jgi:alpha/beta superfamily hydrolase
MPLIFGLKYNGEWEGTMQSPKQSTNKFPLTSVVSEGDSIFLEMKNLGIKYAGKISADRNSIDGKFQQGGLKVDLILNKLTEAQAQKASSMKRSQRVNPPYSYDTVDVNFENTIDKVTLAGTITKPKEAGKYPAVVLVSGSGPQDRNETLMGHEPFKVLADYLTKNNIVVLRYDDRGINKSTGDFSKGTTADFGKDALAAVHFLRKQPQVDPMKVGIIGHSEGGLIATILAGQQASGLNFIVTLAGPMIPMDSLMLLQNEAVMKSQGLSISKE